MAKWLFLAFLAGAIGCAIAGLRIVNGPSPGNERAGGTLFFVPAAIFAFGALVTVVVAALS